MSDLLNSYTFEAKKIVYYSVTVGANNRWFQSIRDKLTDSGVLYVPILDKEFNKLGEEL